MAIWYRFKHWWRARRPMSPDWCATCLRDLPAGKVYEMQTGHEDAEDGVGGTYLVQTFCRRHKPKGARRA